MQTKALFTAGVYLCLNLLSLGNVTRERYMGYNFDMGIILEQISSFNNLRALSRWTMFLFWQGLQKEGKKIIHQSLICPKSVINTQIFERTHAMMHLEVFKSYSNYLWNKFGHAIHVSAYIDGLHVFQGGVSPQSNWLFPFSWNVHTD